jgi:hypothetical protein
VKAGGKLCSACSAYSSTLKMEVICFSETSVDFQRTARRYIPEYSTLHNHRCENLKSYIIYAVYAAGVYPVGSWTGLGVGLNIVVETKNPTLSEIQAGLASSQAVSVVY